MNHAVVVPTCSLHCECRLQHMHLHTSCVLSTTIGLVKLNVIMTLANGSFSHLLPTNPLLLVLLLPTLACRNHSNTQVLRTEYQVTPSCNLFYFFAVIISLVLLRFIVLYTQPSFDLPKEPKVSEQLTSLGLERVLQSDLLSFI